SQRPEGQRGKGHVTAALDRWDLGEGGGGGDAEGNRWVTKRTRDFPDGGVFWTGEREVAARSECARTHARTPTKAGAGRGLGDAHGGMATTSARCRHFSGFTRDRLTSGGHRAL
uniref:Calpain catalytic domain-containing protein n=1 Tax=Mesocestoides corti TaxID=53468 RepID=A0A5K3FC26_MESCO